MIAYAADTSGARNLASLREGGWRILYAAPRISRRAKYSPDFPFAIDNGAWSCHTRGVPFDFDAFRHAVELCGHLADWVVAPDIVGGGAKSLELSRSWLDWLRPRCRRVLLAVQDGMVATRDTVDGFDGVAIGGGDAWKFAQLGHRCKPNSGCVAECRPSRAWRSAIGGGWLHVLRVNSQRRVRWCAAAGADSFDGSGPSKHALHREVMQAQLDKVNAELPLLRLMES